MWIRLGSAALGAIVLAQGVGKWADLSGYGDALGAFELFPIGSVAVVSVAWALAEVLAGSLLLVGAVRRLDRGLIRLGLGVAMGIALAYTVVNGLTWARGLPVGNCTCFGVFFPQRLGLSVMVQDVIVVAWCAWLWRGRAAMTR